MPTRPKPGPPWYTPPQQKADGLTVASESLWWTYIPAVGRATEYLYLDGRIVCGVTVDTTNFSGALSSADDTLQKALETLDAHPGVQGPAGEGLYLPGGYNVGAGYSVLSRYAVGAEYNVAMGYEAGEAITTGDRNVAIGYHAMYSSNAGITGGTDNIAIGSEAGPYLSGADNICLGRNAGGVISSGSGNIAIGRNTMSITGVLGSYNIGLGYNTLTRVDTGSHNIAIGYEAGSMVHSGASYNLFAGYEAGINVTTGSSNVVLGRSSNAVEAVSSAIVIGHWAGTSSHIAAAVSYSTQIGYEAYCTQQQAVALGYQAAATGQTGNIQIGTGTNSRTDASYYTLQVGGLTRSYRCYAYQWISTSDERVKEDIADLTDSEGLRLICALRPISYRMKLSEHGRAKGAKGKRAHGLSAQGVKATLESLGLDADECVTADDENGWGIDYSRLIAPLIKAVQELAARLERLERKEKD